MCVCKQTKRLDIHTVWKSYLIIFHFFLHETRRFHQSLEYILPELKNSAYFMAKSSKWERNCPCRRHFSYLPFLRWVISKVDHLPHNLILHHLEIPKAAFQPFWALFKSHDRILTARWLLFWYKKSADLPVALTVL